MQEFNVVDINKVIDIYSQKLVNSEKENVLLQAQSLKFAEAIIEKDKRIEELEKQLKELKDECKVNEDKK